MKKKLLSIFVILSLVLSLMPASAVFAFPSGNWGDTGAYDLSWYGDGSGSAFTVSTPAALAGLSHLVNSGVTFENKTVTLGADISLSGKIWVPIGTEDRPFQGVFNGGGYAITGMNVITMSSRIGFFGQTQGALLLNISLSGNVSIDYDSDDISAALGGIAGEALGTVIENCSYRGDISFTCTGAEPSGSSNTVYTGGIAGRTSSWGEGGMFASYLTNCSMVGDIAVSSAHGGYNGKTGGLVGKASDADIFNCYHRGDVICAMYGDYNYAGGLLAELVDNSSVKNSYTVGSTHAIGGDISVAGVVCITLGSVGNIYGNDGSNPDFVTVSDLNDWIASSGSIGLRTWRDDTESENGGYPLFADTAWQVVLSGNGATRSHDRFTGPYQRSFEIHYITKGSSLALPLHAYRRPFYTLTGWGTSRSGSAAYTDSATPSENMVLYAQWQEIPTVPYTGEDAMGKYTISTATQLAKLSSAINSAFYLHGSIITLTADIDLTKSDSFDLNGDGDTLDAEETWTGGTNWMPIGTGEGGMYGITFQGDGHKVTGMTVLNSAIGLHGYMGLFGNIRDCTVSNLYVSGSITLSTGPSILHTIYVGGIVGYAVRSTLINCGADVDISVTFDNELYVMMGGLAGYLNAEVPDSTLNCYATGTLRLSGAVSQGFIGGIAGGVRIDDVRNCYFAGSILCTATPTDPDTNGVYVGGITGYLRGGIITNCYYLTGAGITGAAGFRILTTTVEGCGTFSGSGGALTPLSGHTLLGTNLLGALNAWIAAQSDSTRYHSWYVSAAYNGAYPQFTPATGGNTPISDTGDGGALPLTLGLCALAALAGAVVLVIRRRRMQG